MALKHMAPNLRKTRRCARGITAGRRGGCSEPPVQPRVPGDIGGAAVGWCAVPRRGAPVGRRAGQRRCSGGPRRCSGRSAVYSNAAQPHRRRSRARASAASAAVVGASILAQCSTAPYLPCAMALEVGVEEEGVSAQGPPRSRARSQGTFRAMALQIGVEAWRVRAGASIN